MLKMVLTVITGKLRGIKIQTCNNKVDKRKGVGKVPLEVELLALQLDESAPCVPV
jgi:hypothetical protein